MEWWQITLTGCAGLITILTLWEKIESRVRAEKQPNNDLKIRMDDLEKEVRHHDLEYRTILSGYADKLQRDYDSINAIRKTLNLMLEAQWVLVDHAKNGNNVKELDDVSEKLKEFVFDKQGICQTVKAQVFGTYICRFESCIPCANKVDFEHFKVDF